ncbi:MAG: aldo/keto reductase [Chloroflexota bacterium]|nr:MAG: aldo/keto reductase [Chloroflexota bacterium]
MEESISKPEGELIGGQIKLGKTDILISPMGVGTWAWGDRMFWSFGRDYGDAEVKDAFEVSLEAGLNFFDSAEVYGNGKSESLLGQFVAEKQAGKEGSQGSQPKAVIATKFMPLPWRLFQGDLVRALQRSLKRLGMGSVDLYQVHWPYPPAPVETWARGLADAVKAGLTRAVGVSNYNAAQMRRSWNVLAEYGIPLASNQVEYHLLNRSIERNGVLDLCRELGVTLIAYSPLAMGMLTGKYTRENPPPGIRGRQYGRSKLVRMQPLIQLMREIGHAHHSKTPAQVALNWLMCKGTVPIPGAKNAHQAQDNAGALGWSLSTDEMAALDKASDDYSH